MSPAISKQDLLQYPGLYEYFVEEEWRGDFDRASLSKGLALANAGTVSKLEMIGSQRASSFRIHFVAEVEGTWIYENSVSLQSLLGKFQTGWYLEASCSCPVGQFCKHSVAMLMVLTKTARQPAQPPPGQLIENLSERDGPLSRDIEHWLWNLRDAQKSEKVAAKKPTDKFLAYCIERGHSASPSLSLRPATLRANGEPNIAESDAKTSDSTFPKYFAKEDHLATVFYHRARHNSWEAPQIQGEQWPQILQSALARGVLYHRLSNHHSTYEKLEAGEPIHAKPEWEALPDGTSRPILTFDTDAPLILPTDPPLYLDTESNRFGEVRSELPAKLLAQWSKGPTIPTHQLAAVSQELNLITPSRQLPTPRKFETIELPKSTKPKPTLHIKVAKLGKQWREFETIIAEVLVQYGDSPHLPPLHRGESTGYSWLKGGTGYAVNRIRKDENALLKQIKILSLQKLPSLFAPHEIPENYKMAFSVPEPVPTLEMAWIGFLASAEKQLQADGWTILVDEECGIQVDEISDFVSTLDEPTDHGIDWFQFDLSADLDGQKFSLIPLIAQAIAEELTSLPAEDLPAFLHLAHPEKETGYIKLETIAFLDICRSVEHLFNGQKHNYDGPIKLDRLGAADVANRLSLDDSATLKALAALGKALSTITELPATPIPKKLKAELRPYQEEGFRWLHFLASHQLNGILADDMGLGKTVQTLAFLATLPTTKKSKPSLIVAPTSVITNWSAEVEKFTPHLRALLLQGNDRAEHFAEIPAANLVLTSYPLLNRDSETLLAQEWQTIILDEAQAIKNPKTIAAQVACQLKSEHRFCLSGTPMENHLGELWSLMHFVMPGFLSDQKSFTSNIRRPIERDRDTGVQRALSRRVAPLILRRTKDQVAQDLPPKTEILHSVTLSKKESDLYESVRATMDKRVRDALAAKGLAKSHIIILDALLKLRQICCHPQLLKYPAAQKLAEGSKMNFLTKELLPELFEEKRRILLFSQFTSVLSRIEEHLQKEKIPHLKLTGQTKKRAELVKAFQSEDIPIFLISLKAGGTGLNLTAADTVIHYDPWWNPAAENQATDRAHRIGQVKPVFVHKLICKGSIEERILDLQRHKANLVKSLLSEETSKLKIDSETLSHLLAPL